MLRRHFLFLQNFDRKNQTRIKVRFSFWLLFLFILFIILSFLILLENYLFSFCYLFLSLIPDKIRVCIRRVCWCVCVVGSGKLFKLSAFIYSDWLFDCLGELEEKYMFFFCFNEPLFCLEQKQYFACI